MYRVTSKIYICSFYIFEFNSLSLSIRLLSAKIRSVCGSSPNLDFGIVGIGGSLMWHISGLWLDQWALLFAFLLDLLEQRVDAVEYVDLNC